MSALLHLTIATPAAVLVDAPRVTALRAEDESGSFGILPRHADFLTALVPTVIRWREATQTGAASAERYCAVQAGVLRVSGGERVEIACREGVTGDSLDTLEAGVRAAHARALDEARRARVDDVRLQAQALRRVLRYLRPEAMPPGDAAANPDAAP